MLCPALEGFRGHYDAENSGLACSFEGVSLNTSLTCVKHRLIVVTFYRFYAIIMVLLLSYRHVHHCSFPPEVVTVIQRSMEILSMWDKVPFMKEPIHRVCNFAAEGGIAVTPLEV